MSVKYLIETYLTKLVSRIEFKIFKEFAAPLVILKDIFLCLFVVRDLRNLTAHIGDHAAES